MAWTFSDTVIVAAIGALATVAAAIVPALINRRKEQSNVDTGAGLGSPTPPVPVAPALPPKNQHVPLVRSGLPISTFTIKEMQERIGSVPPFQRSAIEQHYSGRRVRWRAKLSSIHPHKNNPSVYAHAEDGYLELSCKSTPAGIASLIHTPQNALVIIDGIIEDASEAHCRLIDCVVTPEDPGDALAERILTQAASAMEDSPVMQLALSKEYTDREIALQIQALIDDGLIKGTLLSASPLTFVVTGLTGAGRSRVSKKSAS